MSTVAMRILCLFVHLPCALAAMPMSENSCAEAEKQRTLSDFYSEAQSYFFQALSKKVLPIGKEATAYLTGDLEKYLNPVYVTKSTTSIDTIIEQAQQVYRDEKVPHSFVIPEVLCTEFMRERLIAHGYDFVEKSVAMAIELEEYHSSPSILLVDSDIVIKENNDYLEEWMVPLIEAFESTQENTLVYVTVHKRALLRGSKFYHFSLYYRGEAVSSITLSVNGISSRIDDVGTLPAYKGRGYASCLVAHALGAAKKMGATYCFLEAASQGFSLYKKVGFKSVFTYVNFSHSKKNSSSF